MIQPQTQPHSRPGRMTAVMRAVAPSGPKVLRIGLVREGRVLEERVVQRRVHVTVGASEKCTFVLPQRGLPSHFKLFELVEGQYVLNFLDDMTGRVALPTGISELQQLKGQVRRSSEGTYQLRLTEDARGKVVIGDTTFLFQFVSPPPVQPKPQLPVAVLRGGASIDWRTTIIAAFAFLGHFLAIGAMYSDWLDPVVDEELSLAGLVDSFDKLPPPPPVEEQVEEVQEDATETAEPTKEPVRKPSSGKPSEAKGSGGSMSAAEVAALSNELDQLSMLTLGALSAVGPATAGVLQGGDVPTGALDAAAASNAGVGVGGGLKLGSGGGAIRPGQGGGLGSIGSTSKGTDGGTGTVQQVQGPKGNASVSSSVSVGSVSNAQSVIAGMRAGFRRCYQQALDQNPDIQGSIRLTIRVGPGGEVTGVSSSSSGNLPGSVIACVEARARAGQFAPPDGGSAIVEAPITLVKQ